MKFQDFTGTFSKMRKKVRLLSGVAGESQLDGWSVTKFELLWKLKECPGEPNFEISGLSWGLFEDEEKSQALIRGCRAENRNGLKKTAPSSVTISALEVGDP